ncbi:MAG: ECF transporter S component [Defluviitaleaceae bacterium]|nr:ECF transporter S component [Defluviitaleaceae bacterium]
MKYFPLITIPLTIFAGIHLLGDRRFLIIAGLVLIQAMLPIIVLFEGRKPPARVLVTMATLCAIAVAGRIAFFMLPQFKPMLALVIISGTALGKEKGFLIGAATIIVSNMFFGQGPWTPWQMFALGSIGYVAGVIFYEKKIRRIPLAIYGALAAIIIYGGIMNPASVLMFQPQPTAEMFILAYATGFPFDAVHAVATVVFLLLTARPMLEKIERMKVKYGDV